MINYQIISQDSALSTTGSPSSMVTRIANRSYNSTPGLYRLRQPQILPRGSLPLSVEIRGLAEVVDYPKFFSACIRRHTARHDSNTVDGRRIGKSLEARPPERERA